MTWHKITNGTRVYVFDPERMILHDPDDGHQLAPAEIVAGWRKVGTVETLSAGADPDAVMRAARTPTPPSRWTRTTAARPAPSPPHPR